MTKTKTRKKPAELKRTDILNAALDAAQSKRDKVIARIKRLQEEADAEEKAIVEAQFKATAQGKRMLKQYGPEIEVDGWNFFGKGYRLTVGKNPKVIITIDLTGPRVARMKKVHAKREKVESIKTEEFGHRFGRPEPETPVDKRQLIRHVMREAPDLMEKMEAIVDKALARHMEKKAKKSAPRRRKR